jgi:hypothetical protein
MTDRTELAVKRYLSMELSWTTLKTFAQTRPVMYGAPSAAVLGVVLGLVFRVGPQLAEPSTMEPSSLASTEETANPISWPSGKVPDYVVGTDFLAATRQPTPIVADTGYYEPASYREPPPAPVAEPPPIVIAANAAREEPRWASTRGDILDLRLPEDPAPLALPLNCSRGLGPL